MKNPLTEIQSISHTKALIFAAVILLTCLLASLAINIPATSIGKVTSLLKNAGFERVHIDGMRFRVDGVSAQSITLDTEGFDNIKHLDIKFSWPSFLFGGKVDVVKISGLTLTREAGDFKNVLQKSLMNLLELSDYRLLLEDASLIMATPFGDLRFTAGITIDPPDKNGFKKITAHIVADQYQLGFDSKWTGQIDKDGNLDIASDFEDGRLHLGPMDITRFNGWMGLKAGNNDYSVQSQMGAGGASLFHIPMQDLSLVTDTNAADNTLMFRSTMAGMKDVNLSVDMNMTKTDDSFDILLKGNSLQSFFEKIADQRGHGQTVPAALKLDQDFKFLATYQPERRFASGPLPFSIAMATGSKKQLSGTVLIYPDVMDIRGSAETDKDTAKALQTMLGIAPKNMDGNIIRLDGSLDKIIKPATAP